ncbi:hypothetical protein LR48_Vigan205s003300 [Vigna angularis]|uniref:Uncharacterized protein n=1 Tax=Phaseolus angularis TaxID=3914 RepID=A0A0L9T6C8_PHAAN|nr:hypothetical protein LR48_Vigan205s003300 [Vigna angularis]
MPKVKQFRNLQKSSPQPEPLGTLPSTNAAVTSPLIEDQSASTNSTMFELIKVQPHVVISPSPTNETSSHDSLNSTPSMPTENIERPTTSKKHVGRESSSYWNVNAIDLEGVIKKIKVKVREVNNLPSRQHIVMEFDEEQIEMGLSQSTTDESQVSPHDVVGRVLGLEHSRRLRCMGLGAAPTNSFKNTRIRLSDLSIGSSGTATSSTSSNQWEQKYMNLESQVQTTLGALKAYMIMNE